LQMPPRAAVPPRGGPARFARLRLLPQSEIARISFHLGNILALLDLVGTLTGQRAVAVELADREVHIPTRGVGVTPLDQPLDQLHHLRDVPRGARRDRRWETPERVEGVLERTFVFGCPCPPRRVRLGGLGQDL